MTRTIRVPGFILLLMPVLLTLLQQGSEAHGFPDTEAKHHFPPELTRFTPYQKEPVFAPVKGEWDTAIRERGWILRENGEYRLWYTGYDGTREGIRLLGYATSKDGVQWTRHKSNPLVKDLWIEDMMVVKDGGKYWMFAEGKDDRAQLLLSEDGIAWKRIGPLDIRKRDGTPIADGSYGTPTAWKEKDLWYLFYERGDKGVWLATSGDMKVWKNLQDEPVLLPGPGEYDRDMIALNQIIRHKDRYYAYYHGSASTGDKAKLWSTAIAVSTDLIHWEKFAGNPLFPVEANKSSGIVVDTGDRFRLYTMHAQVHLHISSEDKKPFNLTDDEQKILDLTNQARAKEKLPPLKMNEMLVKVARAHSANMARQGKMEHVLDGKKPGQRAEDAGYNYSSIGENIAAGEAWEVAAVFKGWMDSKGHRANIMDNDNDEIGIGIVVSAKGVTYYTQVFGKQEKQ